jgi:hypothetical protein
MVVPNALAELPLRLFDSLLLDFVLSFTFFTALCYAVLGRHFGRQRPAAAMSIALGLALATGLVWWQATSGYALRDLGPLALAFVLLVLAGTVYAAFQHIGGTSAGLALALASSLLVASALGLPWSIDPGLMATIGFVALLIGVLALLARRRIRWGHVVPAPQEVARVRHDLRDLQQEYRVAEHLSTELRELRTEARFLVSRPEVAGDFLLQLRRLLPEEGWLTQRLARLRETAHYARAGHLARIAALREFLHTLPPAARAKAAQELTARYAELDLDQRLERLDRAVAACERRIRDLTARAAACVANHDYPPVQGLLDEAAKLQEHNARLIKLIERSEQHLLTIARQLIQQTAGVSAA